MTLLAWSIHAIVSIVAVLGGLAVSKLLFDLLTPYKIQVQVAERDSPALGVVLVGYLLGMLAILCSILPEGPRTLDTLPATWAALAQAAATMALDAAIGAALLLVAGFLNDRIILRGIPITREVIEHRNLSVGVILGSTLAGSGLIVAGSFLREHNHLHCVMIFAAAEAALLVYALLLRALCPAEPRAALVDEQNLALGICLAGQLLAYCLVLMRGANAAMATEASPLAHILVLLRFASVGMVALPITRFTIDRWLLPRARLRHEIVDEKNTNAGFVEASVALAVGGILAFAL